jgi:ABC-type lipoprotein release transport system permease subunit
MLEARNLVKEYSTKSGAVVRALRNNAGLLITILTFSIRQVGLLLLVSLFVAFVATFFPVKRIAAMKPINAIKNLKN